MIEDNTIVSEVTFADTEGGGSAVVGQFVPESGNKQKNPCINRENRKYNISIKCDFDNDFFGGRSVLRAQLLIYR